MYCPKVMTVGPEMGQGGAGRRYGFLARYLFAGSTLNYVLKEKKKMAGLHTINLSWKNELSYPRIMNLISKEMEKYRPDILMGFGLYPNLICYYSSKFSKHKPIIVLNEITRPSKQIESFFIKSFTKGIIVTSCALQAYSRADGVLVNSLDGLEECVELYKVKRKNCRRVPNLIDVNTITELGKKSWPERNKIDGILLCSVGNLVRMKRVDMLIRAVANISMTKDVSAIIIGCGPEETTLKNLTTELGVEKRVHFMGYMDNPFKVISRTDVLVHCSEWEGYSNTVLEAMAVGIPVVSSRSTRDVVLMESEGKLLGFDKGEQSGLEGAILKVLESDVRRVLVEKAKSEVNKHIIEKAIVEYQSIIKQVHLKS